MSSSILKDYAQRRKEQFEKEEAKADEKSSEPADSAADSRKLTMVFKVPHENIPNLTLELSKHEVDTLKMDQVKNLISEKHPLKPKAQRLKILYSGKLIENDVSLREVFSSKSDEELYEGVENFHLIIR